MGFSLGSAKNQKQKKENWAAFFGLPLLNKRNRKRTERRGSWAYSWGLVFGLMFKQKLNKRKRERKGGEKGRAWVSRANLGCLKILK